MLIKFFESFRKLLICPDKFNFVKLITQEGLTFQKSRKNEGKKAITNISERSNAINSRKFCGVFLEWKLMKRKKKEKESLMKNERRNYYILNDIHCKIK